MFSKRHYEFIALVLSNTRREAFDRGATRRDLAVLDQVAADFVVALQRDNPRFHVGKFLAAAEFNTDRMGRPLSDD